MYVCLDVRSDWNRMVSRKKALGQRIYSSIAKCGRAEYDGAAHSQDERTPKSLTGEESEPKVDGTLTVL